MKRLICTMLAALVMMASLSMPALAEGELQPSDETTTLPVATEAAEIAGSSPPVVT